MAKEVFDVETSSWSKQLEASPEERFSAALGDVQNHQDGEGAVEGSTAVVVGQLKRRISEVSGNDDHLTQQQQQQGADEEEERTREGAVIT